MNKAKVGENTSAQKNQELYQIDASLRELLIEAKALFEDLDKYSLQVRALEKELQKINAHFPFKLKIKEQQESFIMPALDRHVAWCVEGTVRGYTQQEIDYLAWEIDDNAKNFRFFLIIEEKEFVFFDGVELPGFRREYASHVKYKKPLIEADMYTRLKFCEYLHFFVQSFKDHLRSHRISIEMGEFLK
jgi:hypothetical protein